MYLIFQALSVEAGASVCEVLHRETARILGDESIHLTDWTDRTAIRTIISPIAERGHAKKVILDVDNPKFGKRIVVTADRWLPGREQ